ncbi:unnamed protein product [Moneuplotes crassus]|uniref:Uncharacterized protein n=1 Tax=Euplotes crassus TaxID=5936 RepID=A0AAD2D7I8_EUPCR|nr:unnamed protein product [Moneuplotes crassus]
MQSVHLCVCASIRVGIILGRLLLKILDLSKETGEIPLFKISQRDTVS